MAKAIDTAVATLLDAVTGLTLADGATQSANLFVGPERPPRDGVPAKAVFVLAYGGAPPEPYFGTTPSNHMKGRVQALVRSAEEGVEDAFGTGQTLARAVHDACRLPTVSGYIRIQTVDSHPVYLGRGPDSLHRWAVNVELWYSD